MAGKDDKPLDKPLDASIVRAIEQYGSMRPRVERFREKLEALLRDLIQRPALRASLQLSESRTKDIDSLQKKLQDKAYANPLDDCPDLCGVRLVTSYEEDKTEIGSLVREQLEVGEFQSGNKAEELGDATVGYRTLQSSSVSSHPAVIYRNGASSKTFMQSFKSAPSSSMPGRRYRVS